jgi:hypothetical protein
VQKLAEVLMYVIVLLAGLAGLAITTCGGIFLMMGDIAVVGPMAMLSLGFGAMILQGVYRFLTRDKSTAD